MDVENFLHDKKKVLISLGILLLILIVVFMAISNNKIDLSPYTVIKVEGLNTRGTASYHINNKTLETTLLEKKTDIINAEMFIESIQCNLDKTENLKNGDKITVKLTYDKTLADQLKLSFKNTEKTITVTGLPEGKEIDVFKDLKVSYSGVSPEGNVSLINNSSDPFVSEILYTSSKEKVSNGDKITITATYDREESVKQRVLIKTKSKEYTVSGLPEYIFSSKQLNNNINKKLIDLINEQINKYMKVSILSIVNKIPNTSNYYYKSDNLSYSNIKIHKSYIITPKGKTYFGVWHNRISCIYSVDLSANNKKIGTMYLSQSIADAIINNSDVYINKDKQVLTDFHGNSLLEVKDSFENEYTSSNIESINLL